jgi:ABC-type thiamine transport system ATPase subunit
VLDCVRIRRNVFLHISNETFHTPPFQGKSPRVIYFRVNSDLSIHLKVTVNVCLGLKVNLPLEALCTASLRYCIPDTGQPTSFASDVATFLYVQ